MKKTKINLIPVSIVLLILLTVYTVLFGNPLFTRFAENTVNDYIAENYPGCYIDGEITYSPFNLRRCQIAKVKSYTDENFSMVVYTDFFGLYIDEKMMNL